MSDSSNTSSGGIGVIGLLGVVFVTLKIVGLIDWSWWWVTAPFWSGIAIFLVGATVIMMRAAAIDISNNRRKKRP